MESRTVRRREIAAGVAVGLAGAIHGLVSQAHFEEWWGYGVFFLTATATQALYGLALAANALDPAHTGEAYDRRWRPRLYLAGILGNALIVALYLVTRTVGVPAGPDAGEREAWDALGLLSVAMELVAVALLVALLRRRAA